MSQPTKYNCVCVIQARAGSSRFPAKILKPLGDKPVLHWVIERCQMISGVDKVICAVPDGRADDRVAEVAVSGGAEVSRGSEMDVLARYWGAVAEIDTRFVMRVTSDCPLLDPALCAMVLAETAAGNHPYGVTGAWPNGLSGEVFTKSILEEAHNAATHPYDREHVTLWMKRKFQGNLFSLKGHKEISEVNRWVLDYPEDYDFLVALEPHLREAGYPTDWESVLGVVERHPEIAEINRHLIEEWRQKTNKIYSETNT